MILWLLSFVPVFFIHMVVLLGVGVYIFGPLLGLLPIAKVIPPSFIKCFGVMIISLGFFLEGVTFGLSDIKAEIEKSNEKIKQIQLESAQKTVEVVTKYVDKIKVVKEKGEARVQYVDKVITQKDNADCILPDSFFMLINSGAKNTDAGSTEVTDGKTSGDTKGNP